MNTHDAHDTETDALKCPECRYPLKKRRSRTPNACEMVCGGCGKQFDICDVNTLGTLKGEAPS
ncbi:MAG: hypothetical protein ABIL58_27020 [Pseudomonadota bacterium]